MRSTTRRKAMRILVGRVLALPCVLGIFAAPALAQNTIATVAGNGTVGFSGA